MYDKNPGLSDGTEYTGAIDDVDGYQLSKYGKGIQTSDSKRSRTKYPIKDKEVLKIFTKGKRIANRYEVIEPIDRGKFGQVIKCIDLDGNNKIIAIKISNDNNFDIDNAKVESKLMEKLIVPH